LSPVMDIGPHHGHPVAGRVVTALAAAVVLAALLVPNEIAGITPAAFLRIPAEGLLGVTVLLVVPRRVRPAVATLLGLGLGLLTVLKIVDMGFYATLNRPFDVLSDWRSFTDAAHFLQQAAGTRAAIGAGVAAVLLAAAVLTVLTRSVLRLSRLVVPHQRVATRTVAVATAVWTVCVVFEAQLVPGIEVASDSTAALALYRAQQVRADLADLRQFEAELPVDRFRDVPDDELMAGLRGKDVVFTFVESYGRVAVEDPEFAPRIDALLDDGNRRLTEAGFSARSAWLTSPTTGAGSWLAHATFLSGLWVNNQHRHDALETTDRQTLTSAFGRADWRTVGVMPGVFLDWPEGAFYGYDRIYDFDELGYQGPRMSFATMPDQYTLSAFDKLERSAPGRGPLMAEIPLVTSHAPWTPLPDFLDWGQVGDGSVYNHLAGLGEQPEAILTQDPATVRTDYRQAIEYSLTSLISYIETHGDDNLVLVFLGDHQPSPIVTGPTANRDVPITIVAKDPAVMDQISGWRWQDGLRPGPYAPVWRMDAFRDEFFAAFTDRTARH
jgi:hypothetical protein